MRTQPIYTARFRHSLDHIGPLLVIPESVDDDCASIGKDSLYLKRPTHGVDIVPQGAEIHIRALLDTRDGTLRDVQHFGHIGLRELPGAAKFFQRHSLKLVAHQLPVIRDGRGIHFRLQFPVVTCHTLLSVPQLSQVPVSGTYSSYQRLLPVLSPPISSMAARRASNA